MDKPRNYAYVLSDDDMPKESELELRVHRSKFLEDRMSRRELLKAGGLTGLSLSALWALACQPAAPAATPTKAPVAVAPTPTKAPAPTPTPEAKIGKALIGKLEGPEVITDPSKFPKAFKEAPALAELVKAGKLPAVKERIGEDPLVIKPVHEIGKYGGSWRRGFTGPGDWYGAIRAIGHDNLLFWDYAGNKLVPHITKGWEFSEGGRTFTLHLRRGMKWSDGHALTADDFWFWWEDMYQNKDLVPTPAAFLSVNFKPGVMERVDTYTVRWRFPDPYYLFADFLPYSTSHASGGRTGMGCFAPAHYLKQFHPKYVSKEELDKKVKDAKFDNWVRLFQFKNNWSLNTELPTVTPWKLTSPANTPVYAFERNPYSVWVDTEGNQLPYIDKVVSTLAENVEIVNLRCIAGEYDFQARHQELAKLPVFLANQAKGGYKVYLDPAEHGADCELKFNQSYEEDPEMAQWLTNIDFRRALSLGVERDQLNETFWLGTGVPGSTVPAETNKYFPGPEWRTKWSTYDPKKANEMLDKLGLDKKDAEGYRLRTDGKGRLRIQIQTFLGIMPFTQVCEMIREHWKKIGIQADITELERSLWTKRVQANEAQVSAYLNWDTEKVLLAPPGTMVFPSGTDSATGPLYGKWFASGGKTGKEPPSRIRQVMDMYLKAQAGETDEERTKLAKELWKMVVEEQWCIGTVGSSPAQAGVRIVKTNMGNIPSRLLNSAICKSPGPTIPEHFYFKG